MKNPKWRIGVTLSTHHIVEVDAPSAKEACDFAIEKCLKDPNYYLASQSINITSVMLNDKESREFAIYVPEYIERKVEDE